MKVPEPGTWRRTSPLAILFFFGKVVKLLAQNAWQTIAPIAGLAVVGDYNIVQIGIIAGVAGFALIAVGSVLSYWFFHFQYNDDSVLIRQGVVRKSQTDIKFDRIQGINTQQNIVFRYFNLVTVRFDTAGSSGAEGSLPAVPMAFADLLRTKLNSTMRPSATDDDAEHAPPPIEPLLLLGWRDIVRIGLADRRVYVILAALGPFMEYIGKNSYAVAEAFIQRTVYELLGPGVAVGLVSIIGLFLSLIVVLTLLSIGAALLRYHNFTLFLNDRTLRSVGGLLTRHESSMDLRKVQVLRLQQGVILTLFGRFAMSAQRARAGRAKDKAKNFTIPLVSARQAGELRQLMLDDEGHGLELAPRSKRFRRVSPWMMRTPLLINVLAPILFSSLFYVLEGELAIFVLCLWIPVGAFFIVRKWRRTGYHYTVDGLVRRSGIIGYRTAALLFRKVQRVTIRQSVLQRRRGLATLRIYMASDTIKVPFIKLGTATQLRDYILYKVESSTQAWH